MPTHPFELSEEHEDFRAVVADFAAEALAPHVARWNAEHALPLEAVKQMGDLGLFGLGAPEAYGGAGDFTSLCVAIEEIGRVDQSLGITLEAAVGLGINPIAHFGTPEQQERWLPDLVAGHALAAFGLTEPEGGSDAGATQTRAVLTDGRWVINGAKQFITNSGTDITCLCTVTARTGTRADGRPEISTIVVPRHTDGLIVGPAYDKLGWYASDTHPLTFTDASVPQDHLLGRPGRGYGQFLAILDDGRVAIAALALGCIRACLELATDYARDRRSFGTPIGSRQGVAFQLADLDVMARTAHLLVYSAAAMRDHGAPAEAFSRAASIAKLAATEAAVSATRIATQVFGGYGFMTEYPVARFYPRRQGVGDRRGHLGGAAAADRPRARAGRRVSELDRARAATLRPTEAAAAKLAAAGKLHARARIELLVDPGSFVEDGQLAHAQTPGYPADGVVTGRGLVAGRAALVVANDPSVKAGSWGARTVEKIIRVTEIALRDELPIFWFVDSAGARITDQVELFPGRRGAGRIFANQVALSGRVPQICCLFGPSAAGGAYVPAFCDVVIMVEANASMYLGSPRMAEMVVGERVSLTEMGGARMHAEVSGCGDQLAVDDADAIEQAQQYFSYLPSCWREDPPVYAGTEPRRAFDADLVPASKTAGYDIHTVIDALVDAGSFFEVKPLFAAELVIGFALLDGEVVGVLANQPSVRGGTLFVDSADKAARFVWQCDAFNVPLLFLADVPGFMIGSEVERQGIIRHGAKMITAVAQATVPRISVIIRKAYGAGLYAMCGPGFGPDACLALPTAQIAVMGPEAAINAVYANTLAAIADPAERDAFVAERRAEYERDIDIVHLADQLVVDAVVEPAELRRELVARFAAAGRRDRPRPPQRHGVPPV